MNPSTVAWALAAFSGAVTGMNVFRHGLKPGCENYVQNTYSYMVTYILITVAVMLSMVQSKVGIPAFVLKGGGGMALAFMIGLMIALYGSYIAVLMVPKDMALLKHMLVLVYLIINAWLFSFLYVEYGLKDMTVVLAMTAAMFVVLSVAAFKFQRLISSRASLGFVIFMFVAIIIEAIAYMVAPFSAITAGITLFMLGVIIYVAMKFTKRMIENAATCEKNGGPDYPREAISFYAAFIGMFARILSLKSGRRRRLSM